MVVLIGQAGGRIQWKYVLNIPILNVCGPSWLCKQLDSLAPPETYLRDQINSLSKEQKCKHLVGSHRVILVHCLIGQDCLTAPVRTVP